MTNVVINEKLFNNAIDNIQHMIKVVYSSNDVEELQCTLEDISDEFSELVENCADLDDIINDIDLNIKSIKVNNIGVDYAVELNIDRKSLYESYNLKVE